MPLTKEQKIKIIEKYGTNVKNTGACEVQVALLSERINYLTKHLENNPKDFDARRRLLILISQRKSLLSYIERNSKEKYKSLIEQLGLRK